MEVDMEPEPVLPAPEAPVAEASLPAAAAGFDLDCYPYTFSPLLLFAESSYFDKGYSNYNSVARFFSSAIDVDMLGNVLYDRKNMLYDDLLEYVVTNQMLVTCCIDSHFTAFQVLRGRAALYYDPLSPSVKLVSGDSFDTLVGFLLLKCNYGDSQHMTEHEDYYTGSKSNRTRRELYKLWRKVNKLSVKMLHGVSWRDVPLELDRYLLVNSARDYHAMSTQLTGNTCYFQVYLFALLCKAGAPTLTRSSVAFGNVDKLAQVTVALSKFLLSFFAQGQADSRQMLRPLTNSNVVLDFYRYQAAPYHTLVSQYLRQQGLEVPDYEQQYHLLLGYFTDTKPRPKTLHQYSRFTENGAVSSTPNSKSLQPVYGADDGVYKLARSNYYKYRACNMMFGFNSGIMQHLTSFCEFNALRKNQLLQFYTELQPQLQETSRAPLSTKYRDYYFLPQFEVGQRELVDVHHYTYLIDLCAMGHASDQELVERVNTFLVDYIFFSTQKRQDYDKFLNAVDFRRLRKWYQFFLRAFMSVEWHGEFVGLGFPSINPKEKDVTSLTQTVFYTADLMRMQAYRMEYEFEKECINQMARTTLRRYSARFDGGQNMEQRYTVHILIGYGFTYSKYNTLMHFLNVIQNYWHNPDLNHIQLFGKDIRTLLALSTQKLFFDEGHSYYHYGPLECPGYRSELDLAVATAVGHCAPGVSTAKRGDTNQLILTDRVYEYGYLRNILAQLFRAVDGAQLKTDNTVLNLVLLSLMLDFDLYTEHIGLLNLPFLGRLAHLDDTRELQVEVANSIHEFDRKNATDAVTRLKIEELLFECSYKFLVNKGFPVHSQQNALIQQLNSDPAYQSHLLLCKVNMSLCQINKSVEVDYYKAKVNGEFRTIIPQNFSKSTGEYLEAVTRRYTFAEIGGRYLGYDEMQLFDLSELQPEIHLYSVRFDSATDVESMVKYIEVKNVFRDLHAVASQNSYLFFIADNALRVEISDGANVSICVNKVQIEVATMFFNEAISFVPCFKYTDSEDVILFASSNIRYLVDQGGQFCTDYYGMKHELMENITSEEIFVDLNDEHAFKTIKLCELLTESKTVLHYPDYLLQVPSRQQLINLLDIAIDLRNLSFFILVLFYLRRASISIGFIEKDPKAKITKITGPWKEAILYVLGKVPNAHYHEIFSRQFFNLNQHEHRPLTEFIGILCENFTKYQRKIDGAYQIVPTEKQKAFLSHILCAKECFHFSEVGSGKTKVILPLLCQAFLSNNAAVATELQRGGKSKHVLIVLVPEHLVQDARAQVFRYCLNLNFGEDYTVYDDIFALMHDSVSLGVPSANYRHGRSSKRAGLPNKCIFVTSFNQFKKALTYDSINGKLGRYKENVLIVLDEVDAFLDRDTLVFNICSNKASAFDRPTLALYYAVAHAAYLGSSAARPTELLDSSTNPQYWHALLDKFAAIHTEIQDASRSVNKSFGIFTEQTLRHCSTSIAQDVEGYKSLIARPYESVNRAMPGSYYSDVERTIYLTYVILREDIVKYNDLFQQERKFISFEYWNAHFSSLDYDDLVYGHALLSEIVAAHPETKDGLIRFLYEIILRRMEIRDKSRSVNSIDVVWNFDCIGFTGTPFIDNYPTFAYIRDRREDAIPDMIDRSFYAYTSEKLEDDQFRERFAAFQGQNCNVKAEYVQSEFVQEARGDEVQILSQIFQREDQVHPDSPCSFNALVDLCGVFKRSSIHDVRDTILRHYKDKYHYVYHIDQSDGSDRVLSVASDNDVQFDEEFYKHLCTTYGAKLREKVFFFVDNRNVIGKDIPFQLIYQRHFGRPLFIKSAVLAHDVDDWSKIWQAMGRSRTMNETLFSIYKSDIPPHLVTPKSAVIVDIKTHELTRILYVRNCDQKMAGNLSSIYQTLISLFNLSRQSFYYMDEIVNTFLEKMTGEIGGKVAHHSEELIRSIFPSQLASQILRHTLKTKFARSAVPAVRDAAGELTPDLLESLLRQIVEQKFEQRQPSDNLYDEFIRLLSGEQESLMEISYTKQQQKQKQKQMNKNQDSDTMEVFDKRHQLPIEVTMPDYFEYTRMPSTDLPRVVLGLPLAIPIMQMTYEIGGCRQAIRVYPTLQFLYSHHIRPDYITPAVKALVDFGQADVSADFIEDYCKRFVATTQQDAESHAHEESATPVSENLVGKVVELHSLMQDTYNGRRGRVVRFDASNNRWGVLFQVTDAKPTAIKPENLRVVPESASDPPMPESAATPTSDAVQELRVQMNINHIRQSPQYSIAALSKGVYAIGMKDQFNTHDVRTHPLADSVQYIADEAGFILFDQAATTGCSAASADTFGPYGIEQYLLMEVLSKQEVASNVLEYYLRHKERLQRSLERYDEKQGKGFVCWRFLMGGA